MNSVQDANTCCIGRFQFTVPGALAVSGRSQSIYRVKVTTLPLPPGGPQKVISDKLAQARVQEPEVSRALRHFELMPGIQSVWYIDNPRTPNLRELLAVKEVGDHAVVATRGGEAGKSLGVEQLVGNVLLAYVPGAKRGFCVGPGAITSEPGFNEESLIVFSRPGLPDFELEFSTRTVREPDNETYTDLDEERQVARDGGGTLVVLNDQLRTIAGLKGKQMWISLALPNKDPSLRFTWHFAGVAQNSSKPMINIVGRASGEQQAALQEVWETVLLSLRTVPTGH